MILCVYVGVGSISYNSNTHANGVIGTDEWNSQTVAVAFIPALDWRPLIDFTWNV